MKNRPVSTRFKKGPSSFTASVKTLFASGIGLIGIGSLLLLTFFVSTNSLQQNQDTRSDASIAEGAVKISQTNTPSKVNEPYSEILRINTGSTSISEITLLFDVITETTDAIEIEESNPNLEYSVEVDDVDHGFKVLVTATSATGLMTNNKDVDLIKVSFTPTKVGPVTLAYDREKSKAIVKGSNPPEDQLTHLDVYSAYIEGSAPPAQYPNPEDFSLLDDNLKNYFKFYETSGSRNEVDPEELVNNRRYTVRHVARIQNIQEEELTEDPVIVNQLIINNNETTTRTFRRADLTRQTAPIELVFETTFEAQEENEFQVIVDSTNVFLEVNENNNAVAVRYSADPDAKGCNERCDSNSDCKDNYACHNTGDGKRCRRVDNLSSSSCTREVGGRTLSCNTSCSSNSQCAEGLTCSSGQCRNPYNTGSTTCVAPSSQILAAIAESCGKSCTDNRGCANNMRCFNGSCRLATNPSSTSCTAATEAVVTKGYTRATPAPTATPTPTTSPTPSATTSATVTATPVPTPVPTPTPTPTPTPEPTPEVQPNESALDTLFGRLNSFMSNDMWNGSLFTSAILPIVIIAAGVILLIMAIIIVLKPRKRSEIQTVNTVPVTSTGTPPVKPELHAKPNPQPPPIPGHGVIMPQKSGGYRAGAGTTSTIEKPDVIEMPSQETVTENKPAAASISVPPVAPTQSTAQPVMPPAQSISVPPAEASKPSQSMLQRLKQKGINIPEKKTETPESGEPPTGDSQPPAAGWPEDSQK